MPKQNKFSVLGIEVTKNTPTVEEWTAKWGADSLLAEATSNVWYRGTAAEGRDLFLHGSDEEKDDKGVVTKPARKGLDDVTGIQRKTITVTLQSKNADGTAKTVERWDPADSEQKYFNRVCAELVKVGKHADLDAAKASFAPFLQECIDLVEFDAAKAPPSEKKAKGVPAVFTTAATNAIAKGNGAKLAKFLRKALGRDVAETVEELAKAMKEDDDNQRTKRQQELSALVGS